MQSKCLFLALVPLTFAIAACSQDAAETDNGGNTASPATDTGAVAATRKSPGERLYLQCRACHTLDASGANGVGPNLHGIVGAAAGAKPGYQYSPALAQSGIIWTPEKLDAFLARPNAVIPGTKMAFTGVAAAEDRKNLIAYLQEDQGQ